MLRQARELPIDLMPYLKTASELFTLSDLEPGPSASALFADPVAGPSQAAAAPLAAPATAAPAVPSLRVVARGPALELDAAYHLGRRSYLIGKSGGHLMLPLAAIPDRAIRIRSAEDGMAFEGLGGFDVPLGPISVQAGRIRPGSAGLTLDLAPYQVVLEVSDARGETIADLEGSAADMGTGTLPRADLRAQLKPPAPAVSDMPVNPQMTVRDLGAHTAGTAPASWSSGDVFRGFEVGLVGTEGQYKGKSFRLTKSVTLIGPTSCALVITDPLI